MWHTAPCSRLAVTSLCCCSSLRLSGLQNPCIDGCRVMQDQAGQPVAILEWNFAACIHLAARPEWIVTAFFMPEDRHTAAHLEKEAELQTALVMQVMRAAHTAVHVLHAQGEALLSHLRQLRCTDGVPVGQGALCAVRGAQIPAAARAEHVQLLVAMYFFSQMPGAFMIW